ncbi:iron chaperone [Rossellomorea sp. NPDC077527]|uniref:iron chaperone n=1 Tax=Rossellomorea sp. NPDC077527 TaxID=3364510 RepID=UPI0037C71EA2
MEENKKSFTTVDEYISQFPENVQERLQSLREVITMTVPNAKEKISYQMPTFALHGNLVHFAAYKNHIGFYPTPSGINAFKDKMTEYKTAKASVQFPLNRPIPYELIREIVTFRVAENEEKAENKSKKKK